MLLSSFLEKTVHSTIFPDEEYGDIYDSYQDLCTRSTYPSFPTVGIIQSDISLYINTILHPGFMDALSRLPPPGGTAALEIFNTVLITSYHLSFRLMRQFRIYSPSTPLRVDIVFDADFEAVLGENVAEFHDVLLKHLREIFRSSQSSIDTLTIKRGKDKLTYFLIKLVIYFLF